MQLRWGRLTVSPKGAKGGTGREGLEQPPQEQQIPIVKDPDPDHSARLAPAGGQSVPHLPPPDS